MSKRCCCSKKNNCCCEVVKCLVVTGNQTILGNLSVDGTITASNINFTGDTLNLCDTNIVVSTLSSCVTGGTITVNGTLGVCSISSCNGTNITVNDPAVFNGGLTTTTLGSSIPLSPIQLTSDLNACAVTITASTIAGCTNNPVSFPNGVSTTVLTTPVLNMTNAGTVNGNVNFTGNVSLQNPVNVCPGINTNQISACAGNLSIISPTVFGGSVSVCNGALSVSMLSACGSNIVVTSPTTFNLPITAANGILTNTITPTSGSVVTVNGSITTSGINTCAGPLLVSQINPCGPNPITVGGDVTVTGTLTLGNINLNTISNPTSITLNTPTTIIGNDLQVCSGTAFLNTISGCSGVGTIISTTPVSVPLLTTPTITSPTGTVTVDDNLSVNGTTTSCAGVVTNSLTSCSGPGINVNSNLIVASPNSLQTNTISSGSAGTINVTSPTIFGSSVSICSGSLTVSTVNSCVSGTPVNFPSGINALTVVTDTISSTAGPSGTVNVNSNLNVNGNITGNLPNTFCTNGIVVNSINACPGVTTIPVTAPITVPSVGTGSITGTGVGGALSVTGPTTFNSAATFTQPIAVTTINPVGSTITINGIVNGCAANFNLSTITACGSGLAINGNTAFGNDVSICLGTLSVGTLSGCGGNPINITSPISFCTSGITTQSITSCGAGDILINGTIAPQAINLYPGNTVIPLLGDTSLCANNSVLFGNTINPCTAGGTVTIGGPIVATGYNLTNVSLGAGASILGALVGPGGITRNFKSITSTNGSVVITSTANTVNLATLNNGTVTTATNIGAGAGFFDPATSTPTTLAFKTLTSNGSVTITSTATTVNLSTLNDGTVTTATNIGPGAGFFDLATSTPTTLAFKTLTSTNGSVVITSTATTVNIATLNNGTVTTGANEGTGAGVYDTVNSTPSTLVFKSITSTNGSVVITSTGTTVNLATLNNGTVTTATNEGGGAGFFDLANSTPTTLAFKTLTSTGGSVAITTTATTVNIESNTSGGTVTGGVNDGPGFAVFNPPASTPTTLHFRTLTSTNGSVIITATATTLNFATLNNGTVTTATNEGPGAGFYDPVNSTASTLFFRTLTSTGGSVAITSTATTINIESNNSGGSVTGAANEGPGFGVFDPTTSTATTLQFRTLTSGNGSIIITNNGTSLNLVTLNNGTVTSAANEGPGAGFYDPVNSTASSLLFKTLTSTGGSVAITSTGTTVNIESNNAGGSVTGGANEGTGFGVFDPTTSTATTLRYRTLTSTGGTVAITNNGLTLNFEAGTVTTASNLGAGTGLFSAASSTSSNLAFKSLTSTGNTVTITNTPTTVNLESVQTSLLMDVSMFISQSGSTYTLQSVYGHPANISRVTTPASFTATANRWTLIPTLIPTTAYFTANNVNFIGPVTSPTNSLEAPGDGYTGNFRAQFIYKWNVNAELAANGVTVAAVLLARTTDFANPESNASDIKIVNPVQLQTISNAPGGPGFQGVTFGIVDTGAGFFTTASPYGLWLYYESTTVPSILISNASGDGVTIYARPYNR